MSDVGQRVLSGAHLLIVEDDDPTRKLVSANLRAHGHTVTEAGDAASALRSWDARRPDVIVLDLGLPDRDGDVVIRKVRHEATTPILVMSARGDERDKVAALEAGADDYVTKPVGLAELRARIGALLRRAGGPAAGQTGALALGPVTVDVARHQAAVNGKPLDLTPREYELLKVLISEPGRLFTRGRLLRAVWGTAYGDATHYLHVYVSRLRRKLAAADPGRSARDLIVAEPGIGYRVAEAEELSER